jgi:hypothetical protein
MNKLWIFGDSYSEPFHKLNGMEWKPNYIKWKGYTPKYYGEIIAERCNLIHTNHAIGGADNYTILDSIINSLEKIQQNDVIIIGWSSTIRFRIVSNKNSFNTIRPGSLDYVLNLNKHMQYIDLSDTTLSEIAVNRDNQIYINELNNYIKLLNHTFKTNKIIHWSPFAQHKQGLNTNLKNSFDYQTIRNETGGEINDGHFSSNAHMDLSEHLIELIDSYLTNSNTIAKSLI